jgi:hypothetical protein
MAKHRLPITQPIQRNDVLLYCRRTRSRAILARTHCAAYPTYPLLYTQARTLPSHSLVETKTLTALLCKMVSGNVRDRLFYYLFDRIAFDGEGVQKCGNSDPFCGTSLIVNHVGAIESTR